MDEESDAAVIAASLETPARFGTIFDRHATVLHRYLVRRLGPDEAESMVGEVFRIAFEKRHTYDLLRPIARPWLYGIATNLVAKHRRREARRIHAIARLAAQRWPLFDLADRVSLAVDAADLWPRVADAVTALPQPERDALASAPRVGRAQLRGGRRCARDPHRDRSIAPASSPWASLRTGGSERKTTGRQHRAPSSREDRVVSDDFDPLRQIRPDHIEPDDPSDPAVFFRAKERFMSTIDQDHTPAEVLTTPDIYPRLAYRDELAAVEYLTRVFQFVEHREARMEFDGKFLCWLRVGTGVVMIGRANAEVHYIHSPLEAGLTTVMMNVYVNDIDAHYAHAVAEGANVTMELADAFFGERRYEATDHEGHRWHFGERFEDIRARGGRTPVG